MSYRHYAKDAIYYLLKLILWPGLKKGRFLGSCALQCSLRGFASAPLFGMLVDNSPKSLVNTRQFGLVEYSRI